MRACGAEHSLRRLLGQANPREERQGLRLCGFPAPHDVACAQLQNYEFLAAYKPPVRSSKFGCRPQRG